MKNSDLLVIKGLVADYYDIQDVRLRSASRVRSVYKQSSPQEKEYIKEMTADSMKKIELKISREIEGRLGDFPIWTDWLEGVSGIGPMLAGGLISYIEDIERFKTISKLWVYAGLGVGYVKVKCKKGHKLIMSSEKSKCPVLKSNKEEICGADLEVVERVKDRIPRREAGWRLHFNIKFKTLCWKVGESFIKNGKGYRDLYEKFREEYEIKWKTADDCRSQGCRNKGKVLKKEGKKVISRACLDGHKYNAAKRKMVKVFLAHLHMKWNLLNGNEPGHPFIIGRGNHENLIDIINK